VQSALVIGAMQRLDGGRPTLGGVLAAAWTRRAQIAGWAVVGLVVGTVIRAVEQRLGVIGRLVGFLGGLAWAVASFLVVPVLVVEGLGPVAAVRRSSQLVRERWGTNLRTALRFGILQALLMVGVVVAGIFVTVVAFALGLVPGFVVGALALLVVIGMSAVFGAVGTYARTLLYRYAVGMPVPGVAPALLAGGLVPRRRRRRR
jgi:hypothetical protein